MDPIIENESDDLSTEINCGIIILTIDEIDQF